jgi:hypothetical protein
MRVNLYAHRCNKAKFRELQNGQADLPFVSSEKFIGGDRMIESAEKGMNMPDNPTENIPIAVCNGIEPSLCRGSDGTVIVHHYVTHPRARPMVGGVAQLHRLPL